MNNNIIYKLVFVCCLLVAMSCGKDSDFLDVNEDPNRSASAEPGPIFTSVITGYSTNRVIDLGPAVSTAGQMWSGGGSLGAGVFTNPERYNFSVFTTGNTWRTYYRDIQKDLKLAIRNAETAGLTNAIAQCEIFSALTYWSVSMLWEDVPYTEAVDVDFSGPEIRSLNPSFDAQQTVLMGVLDILDQAIARIEVGVPTSITTNDLIYGGDMEKWRKFAKSLKLRTLFTLVDADPSISDQIGALVAEGDMIGANSETAEFPFFATPGNRNPFWETLNSFAGAQNFFYFASEAMVESLKRNADPRLNTYFQPYPAGSPDEIVGAPAGVQNIGFNPWVLSTAPPGTNGVSELVRPNSSDVLFSFAEQALLEAEAMARGFAAGGLAEADVRMRAGIEASMQNAGVSAADIESYMEQLPGLAGLSEADAVNAIAEQQWVDQIIRPLEGWSTWRRHEYPALTVPDGAATTELLRRLPYPPDELAANTNAKTDPPLDQKMWFDK
ncbi:MAG: SusD/RagB family nutrient-binding outer membrane lipoprotein [Saprospiraceae bacterium]|nr:SusD/RagB family nutrient-binding outer membrane lipoprotein [Saprospiraceae bacterium]